MPAHRGASAIVATLLVISIASVIALAIAAPSPRAPSPVAVPSPRPATPGTCDRDSHLHDMGGDATADLVAAVEEARRRDEQCGPPPAFERVCRALFVAARSDPVVYPARAPLHVWALDEGLAASEGDLAIAFGRLRGDFDELLSLVERAVVDQDRTAEEALARAVIDRSDPSIVEPLAAAEEVCLVGAGHEPGVTPPADDE